MPHALQTPDHSFEARAEFHQLQRHFRAARLIDVPTLTPVGSASAASLVDHNKRQGGVGQGWTRAMLVLASGILVLGGLFAAEGSAAIRVWNSSAAYNHCWLILPIAVYLAWGRRHRLADLEPRPTPWLALLALPVGAAWLAAERMGIMEGRQLTALVMVYVLVLSVLGLRVCRDMAAPLLYLFFLVPTGAFATPVLQQLTAAMIEFGLRALEIPHHVDELLIETPAGTFLVAEACAGLRFLIASLAFGALYALTMFRSTGRRLVVLVLAIVVPIIANGFRAFGIVLLGHYLGSAEAAAADHVLYGWVFFSVVMLLLIAAGLPFRQDGEPVVLRTAPAFVLPAPGLRTLAGTAGLAILLIGAAPAASLSLRQAAARTPERSPILLQAMQDCEPGPRDIVLHCGDVAISAQLIVFPTQVTWGAVSAERNRLTGLDDQDILFSMSVPGGGGWRGRQSRDRAATVVVATWLNGRPAAAGLSSRAEQAWNSLGGRSGQPVIVVLAARPEEGPNAPATFNLSRQRALIEALLQSQGRIIAGEAAVRSRAAGT